jgi:hypothetical protein
MPTPAVPASQIPSTKFQESKFRNWFLDFGSWFFLAHRRNRHPIIGEYRKAVTLTLTDCWKLTNNPKRGKGMEVCEKWGAHSSVDKIDEMDKLVNGVLR